MDALHDTTQRFDAEDISRIVSVYSTQYHPNSTAIFFKQLQYAPNQETVLKIVKAIGSWEFTSTGHGSKKEAVECILKNTEDDLELRQWILGHLDGGFLYRMKKKLIFMVPDKFKSARVIKCFGLIKAAIRVFSFYLDLIKDYAAVVLFHHMSSSILVSSKVFHFHTVLQSLMCTFLESKMCTLGSAGL